MSFLAIAERRASEGVPRRLFRAVFGVDGLVVSENTHQSELEALNRHRSLREDKDLKLKSMCNIAAFVLVGLGVFCHIYWS